LSVFSKGAIGIFVTGQIPCQPRTMNQLPFSAKTENCLLCFRRTIDTRFPSAPESGSGQAGHSQAGHAGQAGNSQAGHAGHAGRSRKVADRRRGHQNQLPKQPNGMDILGSGLTIEILGATLEEACLKKGIFFIG
jgi:hypothetical protein